MLGIEHRSPHADLALRLLTGEHIFIVSCSFKAFYLMSTLLGLPYALCLLHTSCPRGRDLWVLFIFFLAYVDPSSVGLLWIPLRNQLHIPAQVFLWSGSRESVTLGSSGPGGVPGTMQEERCFGGKQKMLWSLSFSMVWRRIHF